MTLLDAVVVLVVLAAGLSYLNHRIVRLPSVIGLILSALLLSLVLVVFGKLGLPIERYAHELFRHIDFSEASMHGMFSFLLIIVQGLTVGPLVRRLLGRQGRRA